MAVMTIGDLVGASWSGDPCAVQRDLDAKGISASSPIPAFSAMYQEVAAACIASQRSAPAPAAPVYTGPTLSLRKRSSLAPSTSSGPVNPCDSLAKAKAMGQAQVIINALSAKCAEYKASGGGAGIQSGSLAGDAESAGIPPVVIAAGVVGVGLLAWTLLKG